MKVYEPKANTSSETIRRYGRFADRGADPDVAARAWTEAGFARALAATRTRAGAGEFHTIAQTVPTGAHTPRQGAARCLSSR